MKKPTYSELLQDPRWQKKRLEIMQRDDFTCLDCGATDKQLHVHHCRYEKGLKPWDYRDDELRTECWECHKERQDIEHDVKMEFARLLAKLSTAQLCDTMCGIMRCHEYEPTAKHGVAVVPIDQLNALIDAHSA